MNVDGSSGDMLRHNYVGNRRCMGKLTSQYGDVKTHLSLSIYKSDLFACLPPIFCGKSIVIACRFMTLISNFFLMFDVIWLKNK